MQVVRHIVVKGRVQGVGYRAWLADEARTNGLSGWVRNRRDGAVEAVLAGEAAVVAAMIARCRQGPPSARVDVIDAAERDHDALAPKRDGEPFSVLPTV